MATELGIKDMMILTAVPRVAINYGKASQRDLDRVNLSQIRELHAEGHFPAGSMGPKIDAAIQFLETGGRRVMIGCIEEAVPILRGKAGTHIAVDHA
jgi:carbamate kinase